MAAKIILILTFFIISIFGKQQQNLIDTAQWADENIIPSHTLIDSLNEQCFELRGSDPAKAIFIGKKALNYAKEINYSKGLLRSHSFIGVCYRNISDFTTAMNYYSRAFFLADSLDDKEQKAYAYNNIGNLFFQQGKDSLALRNILGALELGEELNDERIIAYCQINLGRVYSNLEQWDESVKYLIKSVERRKSLNDYWSVANTLIEIAEVYRKSKRYNLAIKTYNDANIIVDTLQNSQRLKTDIYSGIGATLLNQERFINARVNFIKAYQIAQNIDDKRKLMDISHNLSILHEKMNDYKKALEYHNLYSEYKDVVFSIETENHISRLAIQYQAKEMEKENELLRRNNQIQELQLSKNRTMVNLLIVISILLISLGGFIFSRLKVKQKITTLLEKKNKEIEAQKIELEKLNATKDKFFSIIGHDLRNPFGSLIGNTDYLIQELEDLSMEENKQILNAIRNSSKSGYDLLENLLLWAKSQQGKIEYNEEKFELNELIKSNIDLHKNTALLKKIDLEMDVDQSVIINADKKMLHTVLNNLINNALKFTEQNGKVTVTVVEEKDNFTISVSDNGIGIPENELNELFKIAKNNFTVGTEGETGTGLGLIICKEFIDAHNGKLQIQSNYGEGTTVSIKLPIKNN